MSMKATLSLNSQQADDTPATTPTWSEDRLAWLALALTPGLGPRRILSMIEKLGVPSRLFQLALTELESFAMPAEAVKFIAEGKARDAAEEEWKRVYDNGGSLLTYADEEYPDRLREIYDAPAVLWIRGNRALFRGPRSPLSDSSPYALRRGHGGDAFPRSRPAQARILSGMAAAWTRRRTKARSPPRHQRSPSGEPVSTSFIQKRISTSPNKYC